MTDPIFLDLVWTLSACCVLTTGAALSLWFLPWSDEELEQVELAARELFSPAPRTAPIRR